jgi:hypothetical protein
MIHNRDRVKSNRDRVHCTLSPPFGAHFSGVTHHQGFTPSIFRKIQTVKPNPQTIGTLRVIRWG